MIGPYIQMLLRELESKKNIVANVLVTNAVKDMEQYRLLNGKIQGLEEGIHLVKHVYKVLVETKTLDGTPLELEKEE